MAQEPNGGGSPQGGLRSNPSRGGYVKFHLMRVESAGNVMSAFEKQPVPTE